MSGKHQIGIVQGWMQPCDTFAARRGRITRCNVVLGAGTRSRSARYRPPGLPAIGARAGGVGPGYGGTIFLMAYILPQRPLAPPFAVSGSLCIGMLERVDPIQCQDLVFRALAILGDRGLEFHSPPWDALESMDVFVSVLLAEGMSNSIMEAMAVGRAVVTTDVRGASLFLGPFASPSGILFAPTENALANAAAAVASVRDRSTALAARAKQRATREFSVAAMVDAYQTVYVDLASSNSAGA